MPRTKICGSIDGRTPAQMLAVLQCMGSSRLQSARTSMSPHQYPVSTGQNLCAEVLVGQFEIFDRTTGNGAYLRSLIKALSKTIRPSSVHDSLNATRQRSP